MQLVTAQKNASIPHMVLLSPRSYCSLYNRPSNRELDEVLGQEEQPYWESRQTEEMVDYCPQEPSCPSLDASLLKLLILYCNTAYGMVMLALNKPRAVSSKSKKAMPEFP